MNWDAIGAVGEVTGAIAVVATLFYLASQIRQHTHALKSESRRAALEGGHTILFSLVENPKIVADIINPQPLNAEEQIRLSAFLFATLRTSEFAWGQFREGAIDDQQWNTEKNVIRVVFDAQRTREWWEHLGYGSFGTEFSEFVQETLELHEPTETHWQGYSRWAATELSRGSKN